MKHLGTQLGYLLVLGVAISTPVGAAQTQDVQAQDVQVATQLTQEITTSRALKDSTFRQGEASPLLAEDRANFGGLKYFPIDLRFRLTGRLHRYARIRQVRIPDTNGTQMSVERIGRFHFQYDGKPFWLEVMGSTRDDDLSVYFTDETNGITTYPAGRYAPILRTEDGTYLLDFNSAYSPYCAYNPAYTCPLPPPQNRLDFRVQAGETLTGPDLAH